MISIWNTFVYDPLYNALILLIDTLPGHSVGVAIIVLTLVIKIILFPLTKKATIAQKEMKELEPELRKIREKWSNDRQKQAEATMKLYQERGVTPFSGCLPLLIQIPIVIGLYLVFSRGLDAINTDILYSFVRDPGIYDKHFLIFDLGGKSALLALLAGVSQYIQAHISIGKIAAPKEGAQSFQDDFARSMQVQMKYVFPVMIAGIAYTTTAAVALYWATSNILGIGQEYLVRRKK